MRYGRGAWSSAFAISASERSSRASTLAASLLCGPLWCATSSYATRSA